jgi:hypothetical protein
MELAGIIAPVLFVGLFTIEGLLRSDYNPMSMYVSALSLGAFGWIQIINFLVLGLLLSFFTFSVVSEFKNASKAGPALLFLSSFCFFFSGPFIMDPMGTIQTNMSIHGMIHGILGGIVFLLMPATCFVFFRRFRKDPKWHFLKWWTFIAGIIISIAVITLTIVTKNPSLQQSFIDWLGLIQRTIIIPYMIWIFTFAISVYKVGINSN